MRALAVLVAAAAVTALGGTAHAAFPGANGVIAFVRADPSAPGVYTVNPDGTGLKRIFAAPDPNVTEPTWSPDGSHVLFSVFSIAGGGVVDVVDAAGGGLRTAAQGQQVRQPAWTADGKVSYVSDTCLDVEGAQSPAVCAVPPPGGSRGSLRNWPHWSSTGRLAWLASRVPVSAGGFEISNRLVLPMPGAATVVAGTSDETIVTDTPVATFDWSPDGSRFVLGLASGGIAVVNADGSGEHALPLQGHAPSWSPDGRQIVFETKDGLHIASADGTHEVSLTHDREDVEPSWQPTARAFVPKPKPKPKPRPKPKRKKH